MSAIELSGISKSWGANPVLEDVNLYIAPASFCVLLGPSGCGKSTSLRIIAGLESASAGRVLIGGRDVTALPPAQRGIAMVFQNYALFPHLNVADNICFGLQVRKVAVPEQARRLAETTRLLGLQDLLERRPSQLSGGQQQRVALARALVAQARVCLMDEPLSNLDAQLRQDMRHELRDIQRQLGLTVVYVTHDQSEAMSMADQVVVLNQGRVEQVAAPRDLYHQPASLLVARFIGTPPMNLLRLQHGCLPGTALSLPGAATLGIRPESIRLHNDGVQAHVQAIEYLGADLVIQANLAGQAVSVRLQGQLPVQLGQTLRLGWNVEDQHWFDTAGKRLPTHAAPGAR